MIKKNQSKSLIVEKFPAPEEPVVIDNTPKEKEVYIAVSDVLDMLAGYSMDTHPLVKLSKSNDAGDCMLCGKKTNAPQRRICWECHKTHMKNLYDMALKAAIDGQSGFTYKY